MKFTIDFCRQQIFLWCACSLCCSVQIAYAMELTIGSQASELSSPHKSESSSSSESSFSGQLCQLSNQSCEDDEACMASLSFQNCHRRAKSDPVTKKESILAERSTAIQAVSLSKVLVPNQREIPQAILLGKIQSSTVRDRDNFLEDIRSYGPGDSEPNNDGCCCEDADGCLVCCLPLLGISLTGVGLLWLKKVMDPA